MQHLVCTEAKTDSGPVREEEVGAVVPPLLAACLLRPEACLDRAYRRGLYNWNRVLGYIRL